MNTQEMELLVRVADARSMTQAAQQLQLTPAAVSAAIQRIEKATGILLFHRTTRSLHPTQEGLVVIGGCRDILDRWQETIEEAQGSNAELSGTLRLSAPADTTHEILEPVLIELCTTHPKLRVILKTSDEVLDLHRHAIDIAIRYGRLQDSSLTARKHADCPGLLVASPGYIAEHGSPKTPAELAEHRLLTLQLSNTPMITWELSAQGRTHSINIHSPMCGDGYLIRRWARAGLGIAFKSLFDVIEDLEAGRLVRVLPDYQGETVGIHSVFPSRRFQTARVRTVHDAIVARFADRAKRCATWWGQQSQTEG